MAKNPSKPTKISVYLYIPNIIGYIRVVMNCYAFAICFSNKSLFCALYFISFVCDGIDGWCARKFNQVSTFGAVLDMVTDRISTACLLAILSQIYRPGLVFVSLLALDIASHWLQMYSTFLSGKASHKDVKDSSNWLFKAYYGNRMFMAYCCVACEVSQVYQTMTIGSLSLMTPFFEFFVVEKIVVDAVKHNFIAVKIDHMKGMISFGSLLDVIGIDEAQFFEDLYDFCPQAADRDGKIIVVAGLDGDYLRRRFGSVLDVMPLADTVTKLTACCELCGKKAFFTFRKVAETQTELVAGADVYMPVCREHYVSGQVVMKTARSVMESDGAVTDVLESHKLQIEPQIEVVAVI